MTFKGQLTQRMVKAIDSGCLEPHVVIHTCEGSIYVEYLVIIGTNVSVS